MSGKCEAGYALPDWGACPQCGASASDPCLLKHEGEPTPVGPNPDALEELYEALAQFVDAVECDVIRVRPSERDQLVQVLTDANAALAKARGETGGQS